MRSHVTRSARWFGAATLALALTLLAACGHTDPWPTGPWPARGPIDNILPTQIVWQSLTEPAHFAWTADGTGIVYQYLDPAQDGRPCIGIVPALGGTRQWSYCDLRGNLMDSAARFPAFGLSPSGRLAVVEGTYRRPTLNCPGCPTPPIRDATGKSFWVTDTTDAPGHRQPLAPLPSQMGSDLVSWASQLTWVNDDEFILAASRYVHDGTRETPEPLRLVRVQLGSAGASFTSLVGTEGATAFTFDGTGNILFLRGQYWTIHQPPPQAPETRFLNDSVILRIRVSGGPVDTFAITPSRFGTLNCNTEICLATTSDIACAAPSPGSNTPTCRVDTPATLTCLVRCTGVSGELFRFSSRTGGFSSLSLPGGTGSAVLHPSPDGTRLAILRGGGIFVGLLP